MHGNPSACSKSVINYTMDCILSKKAFHQSEEAECADSGGIIRTLGAEPK